MGNQNVTHSFKDTVELSVKRRQLEKFKYKIEWIRIADSRISQSRSNPKVKGVTLG